MWMRSVGVVLTCVGVSVGLWVCSLLFCVFLRVAQVVSHSMQSRRWGLLILCLFTDCPLHVGVPCVRAIKDTLSCHFWTLVSSFPLLLRCLVNCFSVFMCVALILVLSYSCFVWSCIVTCFALALCVCVCVCMCVLYALCPRHCVSLFCFSAVCVV